MSCLPRCCLLFLCVFLLSGCGSFPKAYHLYPELTAQMKTTDAEEIRRRWGTYSYIVGKSWIGQSSDATVLFKLKWIVEGASIAHENWACYPDNCYKADRVLQYNPVDRSLEYLMESGSAAPEYKYRTVRTDTVKPDGTVTGFWEDWTFDQSSQTFLIDNLRFREVSEQQYAETLARLRAAAAKNKRESAQGGSGFWGGLATGMAVLAQASSEVAQSQVAQRERTAERNRATQAALDAAAARENARIAKERAQLGRGSQQAALQAQSAYLQSEAKAKAASDAARQSPRSSAMPTMTQAAPSTTSVASRAKPAPASRGPARAWCMQKKNGEYWCNGPLQNGGWGKSLQGALRMVDCTNGKGFTPTIGGGGERFSCERDLRPNEQVMPAADPFRN